MESKKPSRLTEFLPSKPGVYQFFNSQGQVIYVGKAKNLKKRVSSYFNKKHYESAKLRVLVSKIVDIKHIIVDTESDALLLENNLIKKFKPRYNVLLKDDKTYPWICIKNEPFPRVFATRLYVNDGSKYFGPYTSGTLLKIVLDLIRSLYPLRTCNLLLTDENIKSGRFSSCLEYQIGNCKAPCIGKQSIEEYNENIESIIEILNGNIQYVKRILNNRMKSFAAKFEFEKAQHYKEKIDALQRFQSKSAIVNPKLNDIDVFSIAEEKSFACVNYIKVIKGSVIQSQSFELKKRLDEPTSDLLALAITECYQRTKTSAKEIVVPLLPEFLMHNFKYIVPNRGDKLKLLELSTRNAKAYLYEKLSKLEKQEPAFRLHRLLSAIQRDFKTQQLPTHIECFDNSNLQGTNAVSACVVFKNAKPSKKDYRLFNIKTVQGPDDYATMAEVIERRYRRIIESKESLPQLIVIDGGKGQLNTAFQVLRELGIDKQVQIIGIAKRLEEIFFPGDSVPLYLDKNSESLKVIQFARNEAHRFSIVHHRNRRSSNATHSQLNDIQGIGNKTATTLFKHYKSIEAMKNSSLDELQEIIGSHRAKIIFNTFNPIKTD